MCGFAGMVVLEPRAPESLSEAVESMTRELVHRGPDDSAQWMDPGGRIALGFRRLAILDLSPAGRQPMHSRTGRWTMVFNGEVYNFQSIRGELESMGAEFRGGSDSEVILEAVERWGLEAALPRFVGMFALALWDQHEGALHLVRDRMGIKPLYLARIPGGFAFASELGALRQVPGFDAELDTGALALYMDYLYFPAPFTPFASVRKLEPGHRVRLGDAELAGPPGALQGAPPPFPSTTPWWSVEGARARGGEAAGHDDTQAVDALESLLRDAVGLRMIADVPLGALLSGGVDSSVVVALMQEASSTPVRTFTIGFDDPTHDESSHARAVAEHLGTEHTELPVTGREALEQVPELAGIFDEPLADPSQLPTWLVSRLARQDVTVALSGDGGDELFAGYTRHRAGRGLVGRAQRLPRFVHGPAAAALEAIPEAGWDRLAAAVPGASGMRLAGQKAHKLAGVLRAGNAGEGYRRLLAVGNAGLLRTEFRSPRRDPVAECLQKARLPLGLGDLLEVDQRFYLPDDLLQKVDRASMAASLEARVPILDHRVVEFSWTLPDAMKLRDGRGKWVLREVLYRHVPRELVDRPKTGFSVPLAAWLRGPLRPWAEAVLLDPSPGRDRIFDREALGKAWTAFVEGTSEAALPLWAVLMFEAWRARWGVEAAVV